MNARLRRDLFVILAIAGLFVVLGARQVRDEYFLSSHAQETNATVISKHSGHGWIEYRYVVDGQSYEGRTPAESTGKPFNEALIGDSLTVRFDPTHPNVSGTPETRDTVTSVVPVLLITLLVFTALAFIRSAFAKFFLGE